MSVTTDAERDTAPRYGSMAEALEATDPEFMGMDEAPAQEGGTPATALAGEPVATATDGTDQAPQEGQGGDEPDYKALYESLQKKTTSEAAAELSAAGRLRKANEENARLKAERDDFERQITDQNARIDKWWQDAIDAAGSEAEKAEYRRLHAIDQRERQITQKEQAAALVEQQSQRQREEVRSQAESQARFYALAELDTAVEMRAKHEGLPPDIFKPVRDWLNSEQNQLLAQTLPLRGKRQMQGDPLTWRLVDIDNLNDFRTYQVAQAEAGYGYYASEYAKQQAKAEEERVAANAAAAQQTYQPERAVGAGGGAPQRDLSRYRNTNDIAAVLNIEDGLEP